MRELFNENVTSIETYIMFKITEKANELREELTAKGKSCVLSPAAASYNDFKNFEERGNAFRKLVFSK